MLFAIILIAVCISLIVFIHELGHFIAAKLSGVWVEEFGLGLPPRIFGKKIGDTLYSLNALPIGGFVKLHGETLDEAANKPKRSFSNKSALTRIFISLAGIFMNFVLAIVCFSIVFSFIGVERETGIVQVLDVAADSPAQTGGILPGDIITHIQKEQITNDTQVKDIISQNLEKRITITVMRDVEGKQEEKTVTLIPRQDPPEGQGAVGIQFTDTEIYYPPVWQRPFIGAQTGIAKTLEFSKDVVFGFTKISSDVSQGKSPEGVVGILGIGAILYSASKQGILSLVYLIGGISLNLAIFNLIPFPPLDGSRVMFVLAEKVFGKKRIPRIEGIAHSVGMAILLILFVVMTGRELGKLLGAASLEDFIRSIAPQQ
jgi:regulator of sigma E protease